ncbi:MAG: hypothetical protein BIFFINMI_01864 [Phycisphaerae bacterium]|nr:hypothetical protein [Phycisphaerae bacterium]
MKRTSLAVVLAVVAAILTGNRPAHALINPNFTPIHLMDQSELVLKLELRQVGKELKLTGKVLEVIKGKKPAGDVEFDLSNYEEGEDAQAKAVIQMVNAAPNQYALLFVGKFVQGGDEGGMAVELPEAFFNFDGQWVSLYRAERGDGYELDKINSDLLATFNGSTEMLYRMIKYILADKERSVPVTTGVNWAEQKEVGKISGKVAGCEAIDLGDGIAQALWLPCDEGDRLYAWDAKKNELADVTAAHKLSAKTKAGVWADFNADGLADLLSWDGKALTLYTQGADKTFSGAPYAAEGLGSAEVIGLTAVGLDDKGAEGVVVSTPTWPILVAGGKAKALGEGEFKTPALSDDLKKRGWVQQAGRCVVADMDGDNLPDVLQLFTTGGYFYRGKALGQFDAAKAVDAGLGKSPRSAPRVADLDADGMFEILAAADDCVHVWHNLGNEKFIDFLRYTGELSYISKPGGNDIMVGDVNNDGRQDLLIGYVAMASQIFFNRGYLSTGHSHELDIHDNNLLPAADKGQQGVCLGDFNGDGAQDEAMVLSGGEIYVFYRQVFTGEPALSLRAFIAKGGYAGPVRVVAWRKQRCLGAWNVDAAAQYAFVGVQDAGPVVLKYTLPGQQEKTKTVVLQDKPLRVLLD